MGDVVDLHDDEIQGYMEILPAWFVPRMCTDNWFFGLLLPDGRVWAVATIERVVRDQAGEIWLDVELHDYDWGGHKSFPYEIVTAPTSRKSATIKASAVMAAFELCDT